VNVQVIQEAPAATCNYPRNTWWVAARGDEVGREPMARWILDRNVLLYRRETGEVVAMENRCPHRWAPLSEGKLVGDLIQCPYHGMRFGPDGRCAHIPSQDAIGATRINVYPVRESAPYVWIWMGDPSRIDEYDAPADLSWATDPQWTVGGGSMEVASNYMLLHDNLMDLTHFAFVHAESLQLEDWITPPSVASTETTVTFEQRFERRKLAPFFAMMMETAPGQLADRAVNRGSWLSPALHAGIEQFEFDTPTPGGRSSFTFRIAHAVTPIDADRCRYYFVLGWDVLKPPGAGEMLAAGAAAVFDEDRTMIEAIHEITRRDSRGHDYPEVRLQADAPQLLARRKLADLLAKEAER